MHKSTGVCDVAARRDRLVSIDVLAQMYGVSTRTIRRLAKEGKIPGRVQLGRAVRFDPTQ